MLTENEHDDQERYTASPAPTVEELLALREVVVAEPEVLAGAGALNRLVHGVRGIHISELTRFASLVEPGDMVLTTGVALTEHAPDLAEYARAVAGWGAAGLLVKMSRRFQKLPQSFVDACELHSLPLIVLHEEVSLVRIAEAMCAIIMNGRFAALRASEEAHATFARLSAEGASVAEIVDEVSRMCRCPAIFENLTHHVMAFASADTPVEKLLDDWKAQSRRYANDRTDSIGWYAVPVESRGRSLGRLIILPEGPASAGQRATVHRAATALVLNRMLEQSHGALERQVHHSTLLDIVNHRFRSIAEMEARTAAMGFPTRERTFIAVIVQALDPAAYPASSRTVEADVIAGALRSAGLKALVADGEEGQVAVLLSLGRTEKRSQVLARCAAVCKEARPWPSDARVAVCAGSSANDLLDVATSLADAQDVACAAGVSPSNNPYFEPRDVKLRGLMHLLRGDPRVQAFVERTVGALLDYDYRHNVDLIGVLRAFLDHNGNKSIAADAAHISRHTFYRRLATAQRILGMDLDSPEVRCSVHAAIMSLDSQNMSERRRFLAERHAWR